MAQDGCEKNHSFELDWARGRLTVCLDEGKQMSFSFTSTIKINVLYIKQPSLGKEHDQASDHSLVLEQSERIGGKKKQKESSISKASRDTVKRGTKRSRRHQISCPQPEDELDQNCVSTPGAPEPSWSTRTLRIRLKPDSGVYSSRKTKKMRVDIHTSQGGTSGEEDNDDGNSAGEVPSEGRNESIVRENAVESGSENYVKETSVNKITADECEGTKKMGNAKEIFCQYCEKNFPNQKSFFDHRRTPESRIECVVCGKIEPYKAHLIVHLMRHEGTDQASETKALSQRNELGLHAEPLADSQKGGEKKKTGRKSNGRKKEMQCTVCNMVVSSVDSLKIHMMLHTGECPYKCCVCDKTFSSLSSRQHHMDTHVTAKRFRCNPCDLRFVSRADLAKHRMTHEIKCPLCGECFPNRTSRSCHYRTEHVDQMLKCSVCANLFPTQEELDRHLIYHKKGKREQCPVCGVMVFRLKDHMQLHDQKSDEKLYVCDQCPMRYLRKSNLERHMLIHTGEKPYACNHCPRRFRSNGMLHKHLFTHTEEKPFQCEVCGKRFALKSNLGVHMRTHSHDKLFKCPFCLQSFNHKNSLSLHISSKHSREKEPGQVNQPSPPPPPFLVSNVATVETLHHHPTEQRLAHQDLNYVYLDMAGGVVNKSSADQMPNDNLLGLMDQPAPPPADMMASTSDLANLTLPEKLGPALAAASYLQSLTDKAGGPQGKDFNRELQLASSMLLDTDKMFSGKYDMEPKPDQNY